MDLGDLDGDGDLDAVGSGTAARGTAILRNLVGGSEPEPDPEPDVAVRLDLDPASGRLKRRDLLGATVTLTNDGADPADGTLTIGAPAALRLWQGAAGCTGSGPVTCTVSDLAPGATVTVRVTYIADAKGSGEVIATVAVPFDVDQADNTARRPFQVR
jgi:hypothetical protein